MSTDEERIKSEVIDIVIDDDEPVQEQTTEEKTEVAKEEAGSDLMKSAEAETEKKSELDAEAPKAETEKVSEETPDAAKMETGVDAVKAEAETDEAKAEAEAGTDEVKAEAEAEPDAAKAEAENDTVKAEAEESEPDAAKTETETEAGTEPGKAEAETGTEAGTDAAKAGSEAGTDAAKDVEHTSVFVDQKAFARATRRHKILKVLAITLGSVFLVGYFSMVALSFFYFQPNTVINGVDYSFRNTESVQKEIDGKKAGYSMRLILRDKEITIRPEDIGLVITTERDIRNIKENQNPFLWFAAYFRDPNVAAYSITYDKDKFESFLMRHTQFIEGNMIAPENPKVVLSNGVPELRPGNPGNTIDMDKFRKLFDEKLEQLDTELNLDAEGCYVRAKYDMDSPAVHAYRDDIEAYTSLKLTYLYGETKVSFNSEQIFNVLELDQDKLTCTVSRLKVNNLIADFAYEHDTFGKNRIFKTWDGKKVKVNNDYMGWEIDQEAEASKLYDAIFHKVGFERAPEFLHEGSVYTSDNSDIGSSYVEIDLSNQKVFFYLDGKRILMDDIISGNPNRNAQTPGGLYAIYGMRQNVVLTGPGYASHVDYWMPFNGEIGLHDAYWQSKFGGDLYLTRGSHGCVNLPHSTAQTIYEMGYRGLPVVCYWRNSDYLVK